MSRIIPLVLTLGVFVGLGQTMPAAAGEPQQADPQQFEGRIEGFPAGTDGAFVILGQLVTTDVSTVFLRGNTPVAFADLAVGQRVHVVGTAGDGDVLATTVRIQNRRTDLPGRGNVLTPLPEPTQAPAPAGTVAFTPDIFGWALCQEMTCGFAFSPVESITVVSFGQWDEDLDGLTEESTVTLWAGDGTPLLSASVPAGMAAPAVGEYRYVMITPIELLAGETYMISSAYPGGRAPLFDPAGVDEGLIPSYGRVWVDGVNNPPTVSYLYYGGANFQFLQALP